MRTLRRAVTLGLLLSISTAAWGQDVVRQDDGRRADGLVPRETPKRAIFTPDGPTSGRIIVKFRDDVQARVRPDGKLMSKNGANMLGAQQLIEALGLECRSAFGQSEDVLRQLKNRAEALSGYAQPDIAGMMYLDGGGNDMLAAATILNGLDEVEFVELEPVWEHDDGGLTGACCLPGGACVDDLDLGQCETDNEGWFQGVGSTCEDDGPCGGCCIPAMDGLSVPCEEAFEGTCGTDGGTFNGPGAGCGFAEQCGGCCIDGICAGEGVSEELCDLFLGGSFLPYTVGEDDMGGDFLFACLNFDMEDLCTNLDCAYGSGAGDENTVGGCFDINGSVFCVDDACCDLICDIDPYCCDITIQFPGRGSPAWDEWCVDHAELLCGFGMPDILCQAASNDSCFELHVGPGCLDAACCGEVCGVLPLCCAVTWDEECVQHALDNCYPVTDPGLTPDFREAQGYLTALDYLTEFGSTPATIATALPLNSPDNTEILDGYQGQGYDLQGLFDLGELLVTTGISTENLTRGRGIRVGVIEHGAFVPGAVGIHEPDFGPYGHEDLDVTVEEGQTVLITGIGNLDGHHGTSCLGMIGAIDHDANGNVEPDGLSPEESFAEEVGCVGIAPECDLYFFPIISVEEPGGRLLSAMAAAYTIFEPGDVLSFSIGPGGCGTLASSAATWTMLRFGADLGISCCISAGNDCCTLDDMPQAGIDANRPDCDVTIVGACFPGRPTLAQPGWNAHCRLAFSNSCRGCDELSACHVGGWGTAVATLGYGSLFLPDGNPNRSYTNNFGGTSAACPMVAGLTACMQGMAKMFYGVPLTPNQMRGVISGAGFGQCGYQTTAGMPGQDDDFICVGDFNRDAPKNVIGSENNIAMVDPLTAGNGMIEASFFDDGDPFVSEFWVVRGDHMYGNRVSVQASDDAYGVAESQYTLAGSHPTDSSGSFGLPFGAPPVVQGPIESITYIANGEIVDLLVLSEEGVDIPELGAVNIEFRQPPAFAVLFLEMHAWDGSGWTFIGFEQVGPGPGDAFACNNGGILEDLCITFDLGSTDQMKRFLHPDSNQMLLRFWSFGFGSGNFSQNDGAENPYIMRVDEIGLTTGQGFGVTPNGG